MQTDVSVHTAETAPPSPTLPKGKRGHIAYEAESDSGDEGEGVDVSKLAGNAADTIAVTTFTPQPLTPPRQDSGGVAPSHGTTGPPAAPSHCLDSSGAGPTAATAGAPIAGASDGVAAGADEESANAALFASPGGAASLATMLAAMASGEGVPEGMRVEFERVKREIEAMEKMKREYAARSIFALRHDPALTPC